MAESQISKNNISYNFRIIFHSLQSFLLFGVLGLYILHVETADLLVDGVKNDIVPDLLVGLDFLKLFLKESNSLEELSNLDFETVVSTKVL